MKYRKKPVVIEAWQFNGKDGRAWPDWIMQYRHDDAVCYFSDAKLRIPTLEGVMTASEGDWIIKGVKGEIYPCKPDIFEATYEKVEEPPPKGAV